MSIYTDLLDAGVEIEHHESDLYCRVTQVSQGIVDRYRKNGLSAYTFVDNIEHKLWFDIPFMYEPFWQNKRSN